MSPPLSIYIIMSNVNRLINYLLKEHLEEKAKSVEDARSSNLALYISDRNLKRIFLYDPVAASNYIAMITGPEGKTIGYQKLFDYLRKWIPIYKTLLDVDLDFIESNIVKRVVNVGIIVNNLERRNEKSEAALALVLNRFAEVIKVHGMLKKYYGYLRDRGESVPLRTFNEWNSAWSELIDIGDYIQGIKDDMDIQSKALLEASIGTLQWVASAACGREDTMEVKSVAAEAGWGPLLYDITMSIIRPKWLIADRGSLSKAAHNVWDFYFHKRPDVEKQIIPQILTGDCDLPRFSDDREFEEEWAELRKKGKNIDRKEIEQLFATVPIAWRYRIRSGIDYQTLIDNHEKYLDDQSISFDLKQFDRIANLYFNTRYED